MPRKNRSQRPYPVRGQRRIASVQLVARSDAEADLRSRAEQVVAVLLGARPEQRERR